MYTYNPYTNNYVYVCMLLPISISDFFLIIFIFNDSQKLSTGCYNKMTIYWLFIYVTLNKNFYN